MRIGMTSVRSIVALVGLLLAISSPASASPILVAEAGPGVDLNALTVGETFLVNIVIEGDTVGETDVGGSGGGSLAGSQPNLTFVSVALGNIGVDWTTGPVLFALTFTATSPGMGTIGVQGVTLNSNLATYAGLSSNLISYTVVDPAVIPEPATLLLLGSGLLAAGTRRQWRKRRGV